jgi:translation initiation factor IF-2
MSIKNIRAPVVSIMGHVDHGKTSLLDYILKSYIVKSEFGGITQHLGFYRVDFSLGPLVFFDTPGHSDFFSVRKRGLKVTDIIVLVIALDDGIMPQTLEVLDYATNYGIPVIICLNKVDKGISNEDKILKDLSSKGLVPEKWGGDTLVAYTSALTGSGVSSLLDLIFLQSSILDLSVDLCGDASGIVLESRIDSKYGRSSSIILNNGTLFKGDFIVCDNDYFKVKNIISMDGTFETKVLPSTPVNVVGFDTLVSSGSKILSFKSLKEAKRKAFGNKLLHQQNINKGLESIDTSSIFDNASFVFLNVILRCDVYGSIEVLRYSLEKLSYSNVRVRVVYCGVGSFLLSDLDHVLDTSSKFLFIGFNVSISSSLKKEFINRKIFFSLDNIVYNIVNFTKDCIVDMLPYVETEVIVGECVVKNIFLNKKNTLILGVLVLSGYVKNDFLIKGHRGKNELFNSCKIISLRRFKDSVNEVQSGLECGVVPSGYSDFKVNDLITCYSLGRSKVSREAIQ